MLHFAHMSNSPIEEAAALLTYLGEPVKVDRKLTEGSQSTDGERRFSPAYLVKSLANAAILCLTSVSEEDGTGDRPTTEIVANRHSNLLNKNEVGMASLGFENDLRDLPKCTILVCVADDFAQLDRELNLQGYSGIIGLHLEDDDAPTFAQKMREVASANRSQCVVIYPSGAPESNFMKAHLFAQQAESATDQTVPQIAADTNE